MTDRKPAPLDLPATHADWSGYVQQWTNVNLSIVESVTQALTTQGPQKRPADVIIGLLNDSDRALRNAAGLVSLLAEVHPDEAVRTSAEDATARAIRAATERGLNRELYEVLAAVDATQLEPDAKRVLEKTLLEFRRSGVALDESAKDRLREISERTTIIDQEFSRVIRDDVRSIRITPDRLDGLPEDFIDAHPADADGLVTITTDYPDLMPFRMFAADADARRDLTVVSLNRGWPENDTFSESCLRFAMRRRSCSATRHGLTSMPRSKW